MNNRLLCDSVKDENALKVKVRLRAVNLEKMMEGNQILEVEISKI